jgi:hypothetical protein
MWERNKIMAMLKPRHSHEEFARRGQEIFERDIRQALQPKDDGMFVAVDIESGRYEIDTDDRTATDRLLANCPDAQIWLMRVGQPAAYRIGGRLRAGDTK